MKRFSLRTAAIVVAVMIALTGVAMAVAGQTGVLKFLFGDNKPATDIAVQTALVQTGGDALETITVTVRDAVSDGIALHMAVEVAAKNPNDAILYDLDAAYVYPLPEFGVPGKSIPAEEEGQGFRKPFVSKAKEAERILIVGTPMAWLDEVDLVKGTNWYYESPSVLVVDYVIDLRPEAYHGWENPPIQPLPNPLTMTLTPSVWLQKPNDNNCEDIEQAHVEVTIDLTAARDSESKISCAATNLPVEGELYRLDSASFVSTSLGVYASLIFTDTAPVPGCFESESPLQKSFWVRILGAGGQPLPMLNGGYLRYLDPDLVGITQRMELFLPATELPDTLTLQPFTWEDGDLPSITLTLKPE